MTNAVAIAQQGSNNTTFRNRIINGAMMIAQRGTGAVTNNAADFVWPVDRCPVYGTVTGKFTAQQNAGSVTPPAGFTNYLGCTSSSAYTVGASENNFIKQLIEGYNVADLAWGTANAKTVTLSFWVYSSLTGTFGGAIQNSAVNRSYPYTYTISSANTWEYKTITIPGDTSGTWLTTNGIGLQVIISLGCGASVSGTAGAWAGAGYASATGATSVLATNGATLYVTGLQLEAGSAASPFENRNYGLELSLCQRYFMQWSSANSGAQYGRIASGVALPSTSTTTTWMVLYTPVQMRSTPSVAGANLCVTDQGANYNITLGSISTNYASNWGYEVGCGVSGLTAYRPYILAFNGTAGGYLSLSAEL